MQARAQRIWSHPVRRGWHVHPISLSFEKVPEQVSEHRSDTVSAGIETSTKGTGGARDPQEEPGIWSLAARHPRAVVLICIGIVSLAGWVYLAAMVAAMLPVMDMGELGPGMALFNAFNIFAGLPAEARALLAAICLPEGASTFGMPASAVWSVHDMLLVLVMWVAMALAMMLPTAAPVIANFAERARRDPQAGGYGLPAGRATLVLTLGYLSVWMAYAVVATVAQAALTMAGALTPMMAPVTTVLAGTTLVAAGIYQFTPAKAACLWRCRNPKLFFASHRPASLAETFRLGVMQGMFCFGCCWALMTVMFAVGIMNVLWIALLGLLMGLEKTVLSERLPQVIGVFLLLWGVFLLSLAAFGRVALAG